LRPLVAAGHFFEPFSPALNQPSTPSLNLGPKRKALAHARFGS
jgi:hypothetical protein